MLAPGKIHIPTYISLFTTMKTFLLVFALLNAACGQAVQCPGSYHKIGNGCYTFPSITDISWFDANANCQFSGGYLAKIDSEVEHMDLYKYHHEHFNNTIYYHWIGATDTLSDGTWRWLPSGATMNFSKWGAGFPTPSTKSNCAIWLLDNDLWMDFGCCDTFAANPLCEANPL